MSRRRRPSLEILTTVVAVVALAACTAPTGHWSERSAAPRPSTSPDAATAVTWRDCRGTAEELAGAPLSGMRVDCATLRVPQDWATPTGPTFDLALMRLRRTSQRNRIGSLLVNPGGPGGSGLELAAATPLFLPSEILQRFDIVGFDPRGVGRSSPLRCISDQTKDAAVAADPDPVAQAEFDRQVAAARAAGAACGSRYGAGLRRYGTAQAARDMDAIRQAVGDARLSYLGYSYGTLLGAVYATLFPGRIRAMVLDGAVDPTQSGVAGSEGQAGGFEKAFDNLAASCRRAGSGCPIGPDARATVNRLLDRAAARPVPGRDGERRRATAGHVLTAIAAALYSQPQWPRLQKALAAFDRGDPTEVFALADAFTGRGPDGRYSNEIDVNVAVNCADDRQRPTVADVRRLQGEWRTRYPLFGSSLAMSMLSCATWPVAPAPYPPVKAPGAPPILVVGTTGDPATPYRSTAVLARLLGTGTVLTWQGEGHTAYPQTACIRDTVDDYLVRLDPPPDGRTCPQR